MLPGRHTRAVDGASVLEGVAVPLSWLIPNTRRRLLRLLRLSVLLMFRCDVQNQSHLFIFVQVVFAQRVPDGACSTAGDGDVRAV